jgi:phosphoesterase RecJ-like protein
MSLNNIVHIIKACRKIALTFHVSPDGDSLGSAIALMLAIRMLNKDVYILSKDKAPYLYSFLPHHDTINKAQADPSCDTDCVIVLDCGDMKRISADLELSNKKFTLINIDHHLSNDYYGDINYVDTNSASVGEIIFELIQLLGVPLTETIAQCLYTSIVSDTGGFRHLNTTPKTHLITSELIKTGVSFDKIHQALFQSKKIERVKLYGLVIESMYLIENNSVCVMKLSQEMLFKSGAEISDTSDIITLGMDIDSVKVAVLLKESNGETKISLRSKSDVDVRKIAEGFGGGGHVRASGLTINKPLLEAEYLIIEAIKKEMIL